MVEIFAKEYGQEGQWLRYHDFSSKTLAIKEARNISKLEGYETRVTKYEVRK